MDTQAGEVAMLREHLAVSEALAKGAMATVRRYKAALTAIEDVDFSRMAIRDLHGWVCQILTKADIGGEFPDIQRYFDAIRAGEEVASAEDEVLRMRSREEMDELRQSLQHIAMAVSDLQRRAESSGRVYISQARLSDILGRVARERDEALRILADCRGEVVCLSSWLAESLSATPLAGRLDGRLAGLKEVQERLAVLRDLLLCPEA